MVLVLRNLVYQEAVPLSESLEVHQMLSACVEETMIRNINFIAGDKEFHDRSRRDCTFWSIFLQ